MTAYIEAAMRNAHYELIEDEKPYSGSIPVCPGVCANGRTLEECRTELQEVLEDWIVLGLRLGHAIPEVDGVSIASGKPEPVDAGILSLR